MCNSVERHLECPLVGDHGFNGLHLDDAGSLHYGSDERSGDIGRDRFVALGGAFGRKTIETSSPSR